MGGPAEGGRATRVERLTGVRVTRFSTNSTRSCHSANLLLVRLVQLEVLVNDVRNEDNLVLSGVGVHRRANVEAHDLKQGLGLNRVKSSFEISMKISNKYYQDG